MGKRVNMAYEESRAAVLDLLMELMYSYGPKGKPRPNAARHALDMQVCRRLGLCFVTCVQYRYSQHLCAAADLPTYLDNLVYMVKDAGREWRASLVVLLGAAGHVVAILAAAGPVELGHDGVCVLEALVFVGGGGGLVLQSFRQDEVVCWAVRDLAVFCGLETLLLAGFARAAEDAGNDLDAAETGWG
jgi:hypothetical protein